MRLPEGFWLLASCEWRRDARQRHIKLASVERNLGGKRRWCASIRLHITADTGRLLHGLETVHLLQVKQTRILCCVDWFGQRLNIFENLSRFLLQNLAGPLAHYESLLADRQLVECMVRQAQVSIEMLWEATSGLHEEITLELAVVIRLLVRLFCDDSMLDVGHDCWIRNAPAYMAEVIAHVVHRGCALELLFMGGILCTTWLSWAGNLKKRHKWCRRLFGKVLRDSEITSDGTVTIFEDKTSLVKIPSDFWRPRMLRTVGTRSKLIHLFSQVIQFEICRALGGGWASCMQRFYHFIYFMSL